MFNDEEVMKFCIQHKITVRQYFFMYLLATKDYSLPVGKSLVKQYTQEIERFNATDVEVLMERDFVEDFNTPGEYYPELYTLSDKAKILFASSDMAEDLWTSYPVTFPLYDKNSVFLARTGGDKDDLCNDYLRRIKHSTAKHLFVMEQLEKYKEMVRRGEVNGYKISDWIRMELWDSVSELNFKGTEFGQDI